MYRVDRGRGHAQSHRARNFEAHRGIESFSRWACRTIGDATELDGIQSWEHLHRELTSFGVRLVALGNGLAIVDATRSNLTCKASSLGRHWSKQRLYERYGEFVPGPRAAEVAREQARPYVERPIQSREDGLWLEYQEALRVARSRRAEQRQTLARRVDDARTTHRQRLKLRHHAIAAMPISAQEKRKHYKALSFERKVAERKSGTGARSASPPTPALGSSSRPHRPPAETGVPSDDLPTGLVERRLPATAGRFVSFHLAARGRVAEASSTISRTAFDFESLLARSSSWAMRAMRRSSSSQMRRSSGSARAASSYSDAHMFKGDWRE